MEDFWGAEGLDRFLEVRGSGFEVRGSGFEGYDGGGQTGRGKARSVVPAAPTLRPFDYAQGRAEASCERGDYWPG